jgi:L-alanine-DL-glutamate epimerase-like enolase superfamily enzyme
MNFPKKDPMTSRASDSQRDPQAASKIVSVEARTITIPLENPTSFSTRQVFARDYVVVRVRTEDGHEGQGFCYGGSRGGSLVASAVQILLKPLLIGKSALNVEGLWSEMYQETLLHGRAGSVMRAISIVDVALWDRNARAVGLPLSQYLGGTGKATVPAYASGGYYLDGKTPDKLGQEMASYVKMGFKAVKMKVGRGNPKSEEARIRAAREAIGDDIILTLDANNAWQDLSTAMEHMKRYEPSNPYWIEEPFGPDDIENHAELAQRTSVMVATGEIEVGRWRFKELIEKRAAAILQADAAVCGGITEFRKIAATAASFGVAMCPHWFHDLHVHLVAATPNAQYVEFFADDQVLNFRRLVDTQLEVRNGELVVPTTPGLGFRLREDALDQYAAGPWA